MLENQTLLSASLGARLRAALTDEQIQTLLNVAAEAGHFQAMDDRLRSADADLADTVRQILDKSGIQSEAAASSHKTVKVWNELWEVWSRHVAEVGEEKGPYANNKEHWHPPFLDHAALAKDLDRVHEKLESLMKAGEAERAARLYEIFLSGVYAKIEEADDECDLANLFHRLVLRLDPSSPDSRSIGGGNRQPASQLDQERQLRLLQRHRERCCQSVG